MPDIYRVRSVWTGFVGAPGVTTMYFLDVATALASVHTFWTDIHSHIPNVVHIQVEPTGDILDDATGDLVDTWVSEPVAVVDCTGTDNYAAPAGAIVNWLTSTIANHRRLRGRTYLVPLSNTEYDPDGSINGGTVAAIQAAADAFIASQSASFVVWHRGTGSDGSSGLVTSAHVPDFTAVLTSRRD